jgi:hypothetical protein
MWLDVRGQHGGGLPAQKIVDDVPTYPERCVRFKSASRRIERQGCLAKANVAATDHLVDVDPIREPEFLDHAFSDRRHDSHVRDDERFLLGGHNVSNVPAARTRVFTTWFSGVPADVQ